MGYFDISCSNSYLSEIYWKWNCLIYLFWVITWAIYGKWIWLIYLAHVITWARYIENGFVWYISLELLLEQDISKVGYFDISCSNSYLSEIYWKWNCLIYLFWVITWAIYGKWIWLIYLAHVITWARYIENGFVWYISLELLLERDISKVGLFDISRSNNYSSKIFWKWDCLIYLSWVFSRAIYRKWNWLKHLAWVIIWARYIEKWVCMIYHLLK